MQAWGAQLLGLLAEKVVRQIDRHVQIHRLVIEVVLKRLLACRERLGNLIARLVVGRGGKLGLKLCLERPAYIKEHHHVSTSLQRASCGITHLLTSTIISERASDQLEYSAGDSETAALEKSRTLICAQRRRSA